MRAIVYQRYGCPDVLKIRRIEKPVPKDNEILVKVYASSISSWDWDLLRGKPFVNRLGGFQKPKYKILGADVAGRVEEIGRNVKKFQIGDEVFGDISCCSWGGFAEYVCAREDALTLKPNNLSFDEAAAVPQAAVLALQGIIYKGQIKPGKRILINGAGGGAGTFAVQIAKSFGAEVTGVDSTKKMDIMCSIGADHVIDYTQDDFTKNGEKYDLIIDFAAYHSIFDYKRALSPKGVYVMVGGSMARIFQAMFLEPWILMTERKKIGILMHKANKDLVFIKELLESGKVVPVIDRRYKLNEVADAFRYFGKGQANGKVVITV